MTKRDWNDPYYQYTIGKGTRKLEITIDVTKSIPNFSNSLDAVRDFAAICQEKDFPTVLDFGAGKLRNTLYLLNRGFKVWSVEYKKAFDTNQGRERLAAAKKYSGFFFLEYPHKFLEFELLVDAVLITNVINIVPEPSDRQKIIRECAKRHKKNGLMLLMTQYGEPNYRSGMTNRRQVTDGWCYHLSHTFQTFNRQFTIPELKALVQKSYYKHVKNMSSNHHRAPLFERV